MASCIELDLMFTLFCMHVIFLLFWVELNLIFTILLHAGDHTVMSWTLYSPSSMAFWRDLNLNLFWMQVTIMTFWIE